MNHRCRAYCLITVIFFLSFHQFSASNSEVQAGENYAFLVAVGDYDVKHLKPLAYTRNDILEFKTLLLKSGFSKENIVLLHDDLKQLSNKRFIPNAEEIRKEFTLLVSGLEPDDTLIVAMAGHGVQFKDDKNSYFCPADADLDDEKHARLISFGELYKGLEQCEARKKLLLIDACRNDPQSQLSRTRAKVKLQSITRPQTEPLPEGIVALFSCSAGEQAFEWPDLKHGIFFHHVLEGWKGAADDGDQNLSLDELVSYTRKKTQTFARLKLASIQRPQRLGEFSGTWLLRKLDDPDYELGLKLHFGNGIKIDRIRSHKLFLKAANRGHTLAKTFVGVRYFIGDYGIKKDVREAATWYRRAMPALLTLAEEGNPIAQVQYGFMNDAGIGVEEDFIKAVKWYRKAAIQGYTPGQVSLSSMYVDGSGVKQDFTEAMKWCRMAANRGEAIGQMALGDMYFEGLGFEQNFSEAAKLYRKAATHNLAPAQAMLGGMYAEGQGIEKNPREAVKWLRKAAEQDLANAQGALGMMYMDGRGVEKNSSLAVQWYRKAANQDQAVAQYNLFYMYANGLGVRKDFREGLKWCQKAAEQNLMVAQGDLGLIYLTGEGVEQNFAEAANWLRKAAEQNEARSQFNLAVLYAEGQGVAKNLDEAVKLYRKAFKSGNPDISNKARKSLNELGYSP